MRYTNQSAYKSACDELAKHLNTLTPTEVSEVYADGSTTDADGRVWTPAGDSLVQLDADTDGRWFVELHGAAAHHDGREWVGRESDDSVLTSQGLAYWGEEIGDFGYPTDEPETQFALSGHPHFAEKAKAIMTAASGNPANAEQLATWAENAASKGDKPHGCVVSETGEILAETFFSRGDASAASATYVIDNGRWDLGGANLLDRAMYAIECQHGQKVIHVKLSQFGGWFRYQRNEGVTQ